MADDQKPEELKPNPFPGDPRLREYLGYDGWHCAQCNHYQSPRNHVCEVCKHERPSFLRRLMGRS